MIYHAPGHPNHIPDDAIEEHLCAKRDADLVRQLRALGIARIGASYRGGFDESFYELEGLFTADEEEADGEQLKALLGELPYWQGPAVLAVDQHFGGFSGAGAGEEYGGTVEMRLDTLQTRETSSYYYAAVYDDHSESEWGHTPRW